MRKEKVPCGVSTGERRTSLDALCDLFLLTNRSLKKTKKRARRSLKRRPKTSGGTKTGARGATMASGEGGGAESPRTAARGRGASPRRSESSETFESSSHSSRVQPFSLSFLLLSHCPFSSSPSCPPSSCPRPFSPSLCPSSHFSCPCSFSPSPSFCPSSCVLFLLLLIIRLLVLHSYSSLLSQDTFSQVVEAFPLSVSGPEDGALRLSVAASLPQEGQEEQTLTLGHDL